MRDALSLLDQVIAFGGTQADRGRYAHDARHARSLAGVRHRRGAGRARREAECSACVEALDERAPDYREVLAELAAVLQKLALLQAVPDLQLDEAEDIETYKRLAARADAGRYAAVLSDRHRRSSRSRACARCARRIRDGVCCACWRSASRTVRRCRRRTPAAPVKAAPAATAPAAAATPAATSAASRQHRRPRRTGPRSSRS